LRRLESKLFVKHRFACLWALALAGCSSELIPTNPPAGFPHAYAVADCAPWDGPAVTVYLTARPADSTEFPWPQVRISIWRGAETLPGQSFAWPSDVQVGAATRCTDPTACETASTARVSFTAATGDSTLSGYTQMTFPGGAPLGGAFRAIWRATQAMCG